MMYESQAQELLNDNGYHDWEVTDSSTLSCPDDGNAIEWDGECWCGNLSPFIELGLI